MTTQSLLDRSIGFTNPNHVVRSTATRLIYALQPSAVNFTHPSQPSLDETLPAHVSGVNALTIDKFEGRYLLSGGADSSLSIWDLERPLTNPPPPSDDDTTKPTPTYHPLATLPKSTTSSALGITELTFYPFDSLAFLTSSYDHTVKLYNSETLRPSASFDLDSVVYNIALSPIASHLLVACATQHPAVRLIDLRSGASTHSLAGHTGAILSTAWSPVREHVLASGATDGSVRFWDIRRSASELGVLDLEDAVGCLPSARHNPSIAGFTGSGGATGRAQAQAHRGPVNGLLWTEDGAHLISCGHDARIRVWDTYSGANTLANFGPMVRNKGLAPCVPVLVPERFTEKGKDVLWYPNEHEVLGYELFEGKLVRRLRRVERAQMQSETQGQDRAQEGTARIRRKGKGKGGSIGVGAGGRNAKDRITALAWRAHDVEMYSAHADGTIAAWKPRTEEDARLDEEEDDERDGREEGKKRKRGVLEDIYQDLTKRKITFGGI
ncbi:WD40 repeat-like protein [Lophiostoma macrostomum CBS 122681]|uniref:WD40 repeat-like protein n=1 Tax=Lophiostoma macrostomum CBS 122681 TaxID=1314788 RepID=A0A6A6SI94_9PLEO|nr:WD40 repeat-like protein [Lophiostoma macrostomum CBS 122681]